MERRGGRWRVVAVLLLLAMAALLAALTLAAFASVNPAVSDVLRLLSVLEGTVAVMVGASPVDAFWRGLTYLLLTGAAVWLAAYLKPRG